LTPLRHSRAPLDDYLLTLAAIFITIDYDAIFAAIRAAAADCFDDFDDAACFSMPSFRLIFTY